MGFASVSQPAANGHDPRLRRWQNAAAGVLLFPPLIFLVYKALASPSIPFLLDDSRAAWIAYPRPLNTGAIKYVAGSPPANRFTRSFSLDNVPERVVVHVKALRDLSLFVNDKEVPADEPSAIGFRSPVALDVTAYLRAGENTVRADVHNPHGPGLLWLWIEGLPERLATDDTWTASTPLGAPAPAAIADDTRTHPDSLREPTPAQCLWEKRYTLLAIFVVSCGLFLLGRRLEPRTLAVLPVVALILVSIAWVYLFVHKFRHIPVGVGFDAFGHKENLDYLLKTGSYPRPDQFWSSHHPPLFYYVVGALEKTRAAIWPGASQAMAMKLVPFLSGLGTVWAAYYLARRVFPNSPGRMLAAVLVAATLPMNVYVSAYFSNESLHACLASFGILAMAAILERPAVTPGGAALAGALFGLAVLTKLTAVPLLGLALGFLAWKLFVVERRPRLRAAVLTAVFLLVAAAVAGWHYGRNLVEYHRPVVANFGSFGDRTWWQQPGFHTAAYYTHFGESLQHPHFSAYASFGDGIYSTLWGDGLVGGLRSVEMKHAYWNYDWMSAGYLLALPMTLLMAFGFLCAAGAAWREQDGGRQVMLYFLLAAVWWLGCALAYYPLMLPAHSSAKAFFALALTGPLAVLVAFGLGRVDAWLRRPWLLPLRTMLYGWLGALLVVLYISFAG
jgi:hypothetical protein